LARIVRCGRIQASCEWSPEKHSLEEIKGRMIAKHERLIEEAGNRKVQVLGLQ
jgi:predicted small metal-binding protein